MSSTDRRLAAYPCCERSRSSSQEWELPSAPGTTKVLCDLWVTRDVCSREAGEWQFHSSEAIGNENWPAGTRPPVRTW